MTRERATTELAQVYEDHHARVFRAAYRITGNTSDAEDVLQSVFLRLVRKREEDPDIGNLDSYLYRAAINASLDLIRARKLRESVPIDDVSPAAWEDFRETSELRGWLRAAMSELSPRPAEMFALRYIEGYDNNEIAMLLNTSQAVVAVTLHRTRSQLRKRFQAYMRGEA